MLHKYDFELMVLYWAFLQSALFVIIKKHCT